MRKNLSLRTPLVALALGICAAASNAQSAPVLTMSSYTRLSPDTKSGLGASATLFGGEVLLATKGMGNNDLWLIQTSNGTNQTSTDFSQQFGATYGAQLNYAPSIITYNNNLYLAYVNTSGAVELVWGSNSTLNFQNSATIYAPSGTGTDVAATGPPTLVAYNGTIYAYWETNLSTGNFIRVAQMDTTDPSIWYVDSGLCGTPTNNPNYQPTSYAAVGAAAFNGTLYVGVQNGSSTTSNTLLVCDGGGYTHYPYINPEGGISAAVFNGSLYFGFKGNTTSNDLELTGTQDGLNFTTPGTQYSGIRINGQTRYEIAPSLIPFGGDLYVFYVANDNTHYMYQTHSY